MILSLCVLGNVNPASNRVIFKSGHGQYTGERAEKQMCCQNANAPAIRTAKTHGPACVRAGELIYLQMTRPTQNRSCQFPAKGLSQRHEPEASYPAGRTGLEQPLHLWLWESGHK